MYLQTDNYISARQPTPEAEYILRPGDIIDVNIFSLTPSQFDIFAGGEEGSGTNNTLFKIDPQGFVELPAIGTLRVQGMTIYEAQDKIKEMLEDYLEDPLVRITLQTPFEFTILGEVNSPGHYQVVREDLTVYQALGLSGDLTPFADRDKVKIVRKDSNGNTEIIRIDLLDSEILADDNYYLKSEDLIIVDPVVAKTIRENQLFFVTSVIGTLSTIGFIILNLGRLQ